MFEKEEDKLNDLRTQLEQVDLPLEMADGAILMGVERAKREKQMRRTKRKRSIWTLSVAAIALITLVTSIRISPAVANAVASIPGMEKIVALIHNDKGLNAIIENDYYQQIGVSQTKEYLTLTIDGVILDESGMNIFYSFTSPGSVERLNVKSIELENKLQIPPGTISYGSLHDGESKHLYTDRIDYQFGNPTKFTDLTFTLDLTVNQNGKDIDFSLPFEVPENVKPSITYVVNKEVEIQSQKFTIEEITIHPLRVGVKVSFNPKNTMKILQFEDMRLEDENGEVWGSIMNGTSATEVSETEKNYFLQSNYFEKPNKLSLRINKLQAIDQEDAYVIVDTEKGQLLHSPKDGKLQLVDAMKQSINFSIEKANNGHHYSLFSSVKDAEGREVHTPSSSMTSDENTIKHWLQFDTNDYTNPLQLEITAYPNYIEGDIKIELNEGNIFK